MIKLTPSEKEYFWKTLAILLDINTPFHTAIKMFSETAPSKKIKEVCDFVMLDMTLNDGANQLISESILKSGAFPEIECGALKIGEQTGTLAHVCKNIAKLNNIPEYKKTSFQLFAASLMGLIAGLLINKIQK